MTKDLRSYSWATKRVGNNGFVLETCTQGSDILYKKEYKMPSNLVPAFVEGRRRVVAMHMQEQGHSYILDLSGGIH